MSTSGKSVFLVGPGYVGREIIDRLLAQGYAVTTLARRDEAIEELKKDGIDAVKGDLNDSALIRKHAAAADIIFHTATADHLPSAQAILDGVRERAGKGLSTIYLHQSGASFVSDKANNQYKSEKVYSDMKPEELDALPDNASHREIDLAIMKVRQELGTLAKIFIVQPPIIYGVNPKYNRMSIQIPTLARFAKKHGHAGVIGEGKAVWGVVHVSDLAEGYVAILHWLETSPPEVALEHPYFFCESGERSWGEIAEFIGRALYFKNLVADPKPQQINEDQHSDLFGDFTPLIVASNARCRAERLRQLGWEPKALTVEKAFEQEELPILMNEKGDFAGYGRAVAS